MQNPVYVPALDSRPIYDGYFLVKTETVNSGEPYYIDSVQTTYNYGLGGPTGDPATALRTLNQLAAAVGKPNFDWLPYVNQNYIDHILDPNWNAGGGNRFYFSGWVSPAMVVNGVLDAAARVDPSWNLVKYSDAEVASLTTAYQQHKQELSTGGGVLSQIFQGVKNIAGALALPAAVLALPALLGQPTIFQAIAANASGAMSVAPAVDATTPAVSAAESTATASASSLDVTDLSNLASGGAGSVDVGATVAATPVDTAALSGSVDIATGATIPASITAAADATGTSLTSIAQDALKAVGGTPATAAKYAAGLLATMAAGAPKPATRVAVANRAGIGNPLVIGAATLLLLAVVKRKS